MNVICTDNQIFFDGLAPIKQVGERKEEYYYAGERQFVTYQTLEMGLMDTEGNFVIDFNPNIQRIRLYPNGNIIIMTATGGKSLSTFTVTHYRYEDGNLIEIAEIDDCVEVNVQNQTYIGIVSHDMTTSYYDVERKTLVENGSMKLKSFK